MVDHRNREKHNRGELKSRQPARQQIFGINAVQARLETGTGVFSLLVQEGRLNPRQQMLMEIADSIGCPILRGETDWPEDINHQGVALLVDPARFKSEHFLKELLGKNTSNLLFLLLDGVTDPRNFGACARNAATFGVDAMIVPKDNSAPLSEAAVKTASGGLELVPVVQVVNLARTIEQLKDAGVWIVGTVLDGPVDLGEIDLKGNIAIVMGSEGSGLRHKTRESCDFLARIPMNVPDFGLNVSVATGICLYETQRQRELPGNL